METPELELEDEENFPEDEPEEDPSDPLWPTPQQVYPEDFRGGRL